MSDVAKKLKLEAVQLTVDPSLQVEIHQVFETYDIEFTIRYGDIDSVIRSLEYVKRKETRAGQIFRYVE